MAARLKAPLAEALVQPKGPQLFPNPNMDLDNLKLDGKNSFRFKFNRTLGLAKVVVRDQHVPFEIVGKAVVEMKSDMFEKLKPGTHPEQIVVLEKSKNQSKIAFTLILQK